MELGSGQQDGCGWSCYGRLVFGLGIVFLSLSCMIRSRPYEDMTYCTATTVVLFLLWVLGTHAGIARQIQHRSAGRSLPIAKIMEQSIILSTSFMSNSSYL